MDPTMGGRGRTGAGGRAECLDRSRTDRGWEKWQSHQDGRGAELGGREAPRSAVPLVSRLETVQGAQGNSIRGCALYHITKT